MPNPATVVALRMYDGLRNLVSGLGTDKDKARHYTHTFEPLNPQQIHNMYASDWLSRKIIDIVPEDMCREWRTWQSKRAEDYYRAERQLRVRSRVEEALTAARLDGGAAILMGDGAKDPMKPLNVERIGQGGLKYLHVFSKMELSGTDPIIDVASPDYLKSEFFTINTQRGPTASVNLLKVHRSRFVFFKGAKIPRILSAATEDPEWGLSVFQAIQDAIIHAGATAGNAAALTAEAKVDVLKIPELDSRLSDEEGTKRMITRLTLANTMKSTINTLMIGNDEEWDRKEINLNGLPDLMRAHLQIASGAADIPVTRLLGQSPAGLNATGESDLRNYYDMLRSKQSHLEEDFEVLDRAIKRHVTGAEPKGDVYEWEPLWQMTESEKAAVNKQKADTFNVYLQSNLFAPEELRPAVADMIIEDGFLPSLDQHMLSEDEFEDLLQERQAAAEEAAASQAEAQGGGGAEGGRLRVIPGGRQDARDAEPRTLYVRRDVLNGAEILAWARRQGFKSTLKSSDLHVTVMFSKAPVDWFKVGTSYSEKIEIRGGPRQLERLGAERDAVVLLIPVATDLKWRHEEMKEAGASWDWPEYQPHVTIAYDPEQLMDVDEIEPYQGDIVLGPEIFEEVDEDWKSKVTKKDRLPDFEEGEHPRGHGGKFREKGDPLLSKWGKQLERKDVVSAKEGAQGIRDFLGMVAKTHEGQPSPAQLLLDHGEPWPFDKKSFEGKRGKPQACYMNAGRAALDDEKWTYVEGYVSIHGVPIQHAWVVDDSGIVHDPTIRALPGQSDSGVRGYYGLPIKTEYLRETVLRTGVWGVISHTNPQILTDSPSDIVQEGVSYRPWAGKGTPFQRFSSRGGMISEFSVSSDAGFGEFEESEHPRGVGGKFKEKGVDLLLAAWSRERRSSPTLAQDLLERNDSGESFNEVLDRLSPREKAAMAKADEEMKSLVPTNVLHKQADGTYTAERQQLHVEILEKLFTNEAVIAATPPSGTQPTLVLTGGRPAAGKTSSYLRDQRVDGFYISADTIQEHLPGYRGDHAGLFNGEGQDIAAQAEAMARSMRLNIVYDATLKSTQPAVDRVEQYQSDGYQVDLHFTHTAPAVSAQRSVSRFMNSGRYVPPIVSYNSRTNEKTFDTLRPKVDRWWLYDNNGEFPAKIADGGPRLHKD